MPVFLVLVKFLLYNLFLTNCKTTMTYFLKSGSSFNVATKESLDLHEKLPVGNYVVKYNELKGFFYLDMVDSFENPKKLYGNTTKHTKRIVNTFFQRPSSTGVMLTGDKGSGKTLLAKSISVELASQGVPTIIINEDWVGDQFNQFIQQIEQPCMILFDEFEKVYDSDKQEFILTLLDGVYSSKKLYMLTCNDKWRVDKHMRNRPGRIFYMLDFKGLEQEFIIEYCNDTLNNKKHIETICKIASVFSEFNFDMLKAMVEEMNRYDESPQDVLKLLNTKPEFDSGSTYTVNLYINGEQVHDDHLNNDEITLNPITQQVNLSVNMGGFKLQNSTKRNSIQPGFIPPGLASDDDDDDDDWEYLKFTPDQLVKVDAVSGKFVYEDGQGKRLVLLKKKPKFFNISDAF